MAAAESEVRRWRFRGWLKDGLILTATQASTSVVTAALAIVIARSLSPGGFGLFSAFLGLSQALSILVDLGVGSYLLREFSTSGIDQLTHRTQVTQLLSTALSWFGLAVAAVLGLTIVGLLVSAQPITNGLVLIGLLLYTTASSAALIIETVARSERKISVVMAGAVVEKVFLLGSVSALLALGQGLLEIGVAFATAGVIHLMLALALVGRIFQVSLVHVSFATIHALTRKLLPFAMNRVALNLVPRLDAIIIAAFSVTAAGYFAVGDRMLGAVLVIPAAMSSTLYPFLARSVDSRRHARLANMALLFAGLAICVIAEAWLPQVVQILFGNGYSGAVPAVRVMILSLPLIFLSSGLLAQLYTHRQESAVAHVTIGAAVLGTVGVVVGTQLAGAEGAACGYTGRFALFTGALVALAFREARLAKSP